MVDGDTSGFYFYVITCRQCFLVLFLILNLVFIQLFCYFVNQWKCLIYNKWKQRKRIHLYGIYCDADKVHVQIKAHHQSKHHGSRTHLHIASI